MNTQAKKPHRDRFIASKNQLMTKAKKSAAAKKSSVANKTAKK